MSLTDNALSQIRARLANPEGRNDYQLMESVLRLSAMWRSMMLANTVGSKDGLVVQNGPFKGMAYLATGSEGALLPRLIGSYESELHPYVEAMADEGLTDIVDVGCAEGFYAVGLARLMPGVRIHAFDIDPNARSKCAALAELNGVRDRITVGGAFSGDDFAAYPAKSTLVFMDIEGEERNLLNPALYPALKHLKIIVETHPIPREDVTADLIARFTDSHDIIRVEQEGKTTPLPPWIAELSHMDQILAGWEWRLRPTPWLIMRPKSQEP